MDQISQWWPVIVLLLAVFDKEAALFTAALYAATAMTGPVEASIVLFIATLFVNGFHYRQGLRSIDIKCDSEMPNRLPTDKIRHWLNRFGLPVTAALVQTVFNRGESIRALSQVSERRRETLLFMALFALLWATVGVFCLSAVGQWLIGEFSTLTKVRFILPGLTILIIVCSTVFRIALTRFLFHYYGKNK